MLWTAQLDPKGCFQVLAWPYFETQCRQSYWFCRQRYRCRKQRLKCFWQQPWQQAGPVLQMYRLTVEVMLPQDWLQSELSYLACYWFFPAMECSLLAQLVKEVAQNICLQTLFKDCSFISKMLLFHYKMSKVTCNLFLLPQFIMSSTLIKHLFVTSA